MAKEVTKENLLNYAKEHLRDTANAVFAGILDAKTAKGHTQELFYLSATFVLGLQEEARKLRKELEERLGK